MLLVEHKKCCQQKSDHRPASDDSSLLRHRNCSMAWVNIAGASLQGLTFAATDLMGAHIEQTNFANASGFSPGLRSAHASFSRVRLMTPKSSHYMNTNLTACLLNTSSCMITQTLCRLAATSAWLSA